jgi:hypothetical protein
MTLLWQILTISSVIIPRLVTNFATFVDLIPSKSQNIPRALGSGCFDRNQVFRFK